MDRFCPECGAPRVGGELRCERCGHEFAPAPARSSEAPAAARAPTGGFSGLTPSQLGPRPLLIAAAVVAAILVALVAVWAFGASRGGLAGEPRTLVYNNELVPVTVGDKCGYIDANGRIVLNPQWDDTDLFIKDAHAAPVRSGDKWGLIDAKGAYVVEPQFDNLSTTSEPAVFWVMVGKQWGTIDYKGAFVINPQFDEKSTFDAAGRARIKINGKMGFVDRRGRMLINPQFDDIWYAAYGNGGIDYFPQGLAPARSGRKWGFINPSGAWVINPQFDDTGAFDKSGLAPVEIVSTSAVQTQDPFDRGAGATVSVEDAKWGYIDRTGRMVVSPQFDNARQFFSSGLAPVKVGALWGYIDTHGKLRINPQYANALVFAPAGKGQLAWVGMHTAGQSDDTDLRYGAIDQSGRMRIAPQFNDISAFDENGRATVTINGAKGLIDTRGRFIASPIYTSMKHFAGSGVYLYTKAPGPNAPAGASEIGRMDKAGKVLTTYLGSTC